ncbi:1236_t:CDS:2 [Entrophospora sp. SA101]|nr:1236_t:CDS:2 [Entrophospora sp. SA101]
MKKNYSVIARRRQKGICFIADSIITSYLKTPLQRLAIKIEGSHLEEKKKSSLMRATQETNELFKETLKKFGILVIPVLIASVIDTEGEMQVFAPNDNENTKPIGRVVKIGGEKRRLKPDESPFAASKHGPYQQTKRLNTYQKYAQELLAKQKVYYCFCSKEELAQEKADFLTKSKRVNYQYSRKCLQLDKEQIQNFLQAQKSYVLRLKVPQEKDYTFQDLVRGKIIFQGKDIEDFVIFRHNGLPLLNFAVVIDDHLMEISHVLRGEEHLSNTAKQLVLYEADQETSEFQMICQLRQKGYLPQAITNYLLFLGWHPGERATQEIFNLKEASGSFDLKSLHSRGAVFALEKLNWYNNYYIQQLDQEEFAEQT